MIFGAIFIIFHFTL